MTYVKDEEYTEEYTVQNKAIVKLAKLALSGLSELRDVFVGPMPRTEMQTKLNLQIYSLRCFLVEIIVASDKGTQPGMSEDHGMQELYSSYVDIYTWMRLSVRIYIDGSFRHPATEVGQTSG